jgi:uncharacterized membrane protein YfcA
MQLTLTTFLIVCPLVFLAGFVDAIAGGGGLISLPAYLLAGLAPHYAIATNKLSAFMGVSLSGARFYKNKMIDLKLALPSMALAVAGSACGARLILSVSDAAIKYMLLFALPGVAFFMLRKKDLDEHAAPIARKKQWLIVLTASLVIGVYDGFYGPGTVTFLLIVYSQLAKMPVRLAARQRQGSQLRFQPRQPGRLYLERPHALRAGADRRTFQPARQLPRLWHGA